MVATLDSGSHLCTIGGPLLCLFPSLHRRRFRVWTPPITGCYSCCWTGFENRLRPFCTDSWYFTFQGSSVIFGSSDNTWNAAINWYPLHTDRVHGHAPTVLTNKVAFYEIERNSPCVLSLKTRTRVYYHREWWSCSMQPSSIDPGRLAPVHGESRSASSFENTMSDESGAQYNRKPQRTFQLGCLLARVTTVDPTIMYHATIRSLVFSTSRLLLRKNNLSII
jgi:hypothetical protein